MPAQVIRDCEATFDWLFISINCSFLSAFQRAIRDFEANGRSGVPKAVVFVSDGFYTNDDPVAPAATLRGPPYDTSIICVGKT